MIWECPALHSQLFRFLLIPNLHTTTMEKLYKDNAVRTPHCCDPGILLWTKISQSSFVKAKLRDSCEVVVLYSRESVATCERRPQTLVAWPVRWRLPTITRLLPYQGTPLRAERAWRDSLSRLLFTIAEFWTRQHDLSVCVFVVRLQNKCSKRFSLFKSSLGGWFSHQLGLLFHIL